MSRTERLHNAVTPGSIVVALFLTWLNANLMRDDIGQSGLGVGIVLALVVAGIAGSRPLWDEEFTEGQRFGYRGWHVFWKYYGPIGIAASVLVNVFISVSNDHYEGSNWLGNEFVIVVAVIGVALFAIPMTPVRQIGSGLLVGIGLPLLFPVVLILVLLAIPAAPVYLVTSIACWIVAKRRTKPAVDSSDPSTSHPFA